MPEYANEQIQEATAFFILDESLHAQPHQQVRQRTFHRGQQR
jgi:hypothetical protein